MSTRDEVHRLKKELAFWQRIHEHESMDEREFNLERQIRQLENRDEFGVPRYNGHVEDDDDEDCHEQTPKVVKCRYCGKSGLKWMQIDGRWRLAEKDGLHFCKEFSCRKANTPSHKL